MKGAVGIRGVMRFIIRSFRTCEVMIRGSVIGDLRFGERMSVRGPVYPILTPYVTMLGRIFARQS
jgi:hypothetical protein